MTISELIEVLQEQQEHLGPDVEVRIMEQPNWPFEYEVDGVISQPSDPMPYKRTCSWVFAPIAFSVRKSFWKKFLGNGVTSVTSTENIHIFLARLARLARLIASKSARATLCTAKNKNPQKNL